MRVFSDIVFVYHPGTLGDVLLSLATIQKIREVERSNIHLCCKSTVGQFLKDISEVEDISDIDSSFYSPLFTDNHSELKDFFLRFKKVYCFVRHTDSLVCKNLKGLCKGVILVKTIPQERMHVALYRFSQIAPKESFIKKRLNIDGNLLKDTLKFFQAPLERFVLIHPGSGSKDKNMPFALFLKISDFIINLKNIGVLFITGEAEDKIMICDIDRYVNKVSPLCQHIRCPTLLEASSLIRLSTLYIGNDSGISHLAGLINKTMIVFFKDTDPKLWAPIGDDVTVIKYTDLIVDDVLHLVASKIPI